MTDKTPEIENEIVAEARAARAGKDAAAKTPEPARRRTWQIAAIGAGIGSAALTAALLYANRGRKKK